MSLSAGADLLDRLRRTKCGYSQDDFTVGLIDLGYELVREARHGKIFRHPILASHPNLDVRMRNAQILIPKGRELKEYVAREVLASVEILMAYGKERGGE